MAPQTSGATSARSVPVVEAPRPRRNRHRYLGLASTLGIGISLSVGAFFTAFEQEEQRIEAQFEWLATERALTVQHEVVDEVDILGSIAALFGASQLVEREEFYVFAREILARHSGVRALAWAAARQSNVDQGDRFPLQYLEAGGEDGGPLGYDLAESPAWRAEMDRALGAAGPIATRRVGLGRLTQPPSRFVALLPVFGSGSQPGTLPARDAHVQGFLVGVFDARHIVEDALAPFNSSPVGIDVALYDHPAAGEGALLYDRPSLLPHTSALSTIALGRPALRYVKTFEVGARDWAVACTAAPEFVSTHPIREPWIVLAIGLVSTTGVTLFVWALIRRAEHVEKIVKQRTGELSRANQQLARANQQLGEEIVERNRAEDALRRAHDSLELRVEQRTAELSGVVSELERANHLKSEFVSTMSHELRTPLNVILGFVEMARDPTFGPDERQNLFERIEAAGLELLEMVQSTLDIGKLEAGVDEPCLKPVCLPELWAALERDCACLPRAKSVSLEWSGDAPDMVFATDPRKLTGALRNLVGNALKFTDHGKVSVSVRRDAESLVFRVEDTGVGIREQDLEAIFEMFRQGDGSDSRVYGGTGLGLYIARRAVEQLGGRIAVVSRVGHGSVFTIVLPLSAGMRGSTTALGSAAV